MRHRISCYCLQVTVYTAAVYSVQCCTVATATLSHSRPGYETRGKSWVS